MFCQLRMDGPAKKKSLLLQIRTHCKHALTQEHRAALEAASCRKDMQRAVATVYSQEEQAVLAGLRSICIMYVFRNVFLATIKSDWLQLFRQSSHFGYNFFGARGTPVHVLPVVACTETCSNKS